MKQPYFGSRDGEPIAIARAILFVERDRLAIVAALDNVQRLIRQEMASKPHYRLSPNARSSAIR
jgi:hypothetical protein